MKLIIVIVLLIVLVAGFLAAWFRERTQKRVFPADDAASLLNPLRRYLQPISSTVAKFGIAPGDVVLELGPGPGYFSVGAARTAGPRGRLICADIQPAMLQRLRARLPVDVGNVDLVVADAQHLPFRSQSIDAAFLVTVLGEVPDPARAVRELSRTLRDAGTLSFCESLRDPDYVGQGELRRLCWDAGLALVDRNRQPLGYIARFSPSPVAADRPPVR